MASKEGIKHLPPKVLKTLGQVAGFDDPVSWSNLLSLTGKAEQDSLKWWEADDGGDVYIYAKNLPYDWNKGPKRGVTIGIVGFTTHHEGKPQGDAQDLFKEYAKLGGEDLGPMSRKCDCEADDCKKLIAKIKGLKNDDKWQQAQWNRMVSSGGYIFESVKLLKKYKVPVTPLALAAIYDAGMNQGITGKHGAADMAKDVPESAHGNADKFVAAFLKIRKPIAGTGAFNDPPVNGHNRVQQYVDLLEKKCWDLKDDALVKKATSWAMK